MYMFQISQSQISAKYAFALFQMILAFGEKSSPTELCRRLPRAFPFILSRGRPEKVVPSSTFFQILAKVTKTVEKQQVLMQSFFIYNSGPGVIVLFSRFYSICKYIYPSLHIDIPICIYKLIQIFGDPQCYILREGCQNSTGLIKSFMQTVLSRETSI